MDAGGGRIASTGAMTGRVGAGPSRASPEMRPGSHHDDWAATPQAAPQSLGKTPMCSNAVAPSYSNDINEHVMTRCVGERRI